MLQVSKSLKLKLLENCLYRITYRYLKRIAHTVNVGGYGIYTEKDLIEYNNVIVNGRRVIDIDINRFSVKPVLPKVFFKNMLSVKLTNKGTGEIIKNPDYTSHRYTVGRFIIDTLPPSEYEIEGKLWVDDLDSTWTVPIKYTFRVSY